MKDKWGMDEYIAVIDVKPYASDMECFVPLMEKFNLYTQRCRRDQKQKNLYKETTKPTFAGVGVS